MVHNLSGCERERPSVTSLSDIILQKCRLIIIASCGNDWFPYVSSESSFITKRFENCKSPRKFYTYLRF